ncbi:hypothetical protein SEA_CULVER_174 [Gordonia phage Culver]|nr:hypothetical protein SEA_WILLIAMBOONE_176 [Gordonia phage WilliamBoone]WNM66461.1 hypothetical protein SEA_CULVER_174 [Gordonia phage Culver]
MARATKADQKRETLRRREIRRFKYQEM